MSWVRLTEVPAPKRVRCVPVFAGLALICLATSLAGRTTIATAATAPFDKTGLGASSKNDRAHRKGAGGIARPAAQSASKPRCHGRRPPRKRHSVRARPARRQRSQRVDRRRADRHRARPRRCSTPRRRHRKASGKTGTPPTSASSSAPAPRNCFENPETEGTSRIEACGYPGAHNTGPGGEGEGKCSSYPEAGNQTIEAAGEIKEKRFTALTIKASDVTLNDVCIVGTSSSFTLVNVLGENFTIKNSVIRGTGTAESGATEAAVWNWEPNARAISDYMTNCTECVHGKWTLEQSYVLVNAEKAGAHYEDVYSGETSFSGTDDTLFNKFPQTAVLFGEGERNSGAVLSLTNSFLAGAGYVVHPVATFNFTGNRIARCLTTPFVEERGLTFCNGAHEGNFSTSFDAHGYYPNGGSFGMDGTPESYILSKTWSGNYWDDNLETLPAP